MRALLLLLGCWYSLRIELNRQMRHRSMACQSIHSNGSSLFSCHACSQSAQHPAAVTLSTVQDMNCRHFVRRVGYIALPAMCSCDNLQHGFSICSQCSSTDYGSYIICSVIETQKRNKIVE